MAKRPYDKDGTNKSEALREAIRELGMDAPNVEIQDWIEKHWEGWVWGQNKAGEIGAARKSIAKATAAGVAADNAPRRGRPAGKRAVKVAVRKKPGRQPKPDVTQPVPIAAVRAAVSLITSAPNVQAAIAKAQSLLLANSSAQVMAMLDLLTD